MKKIFSLVVICLFVMGGLAFGANNYASDNVEIMGPVMGPIGITPATKIIKVRYAYQPPDTIQTGLSSGDVVVWDSNSADGYTISGNINNVDSLFAGVLVTDIATADSAVVKGNGRNVGYMAVEGYVLANCDTSACTTGMAIQPNGGVLANSFSTLAGIDAPLSSDLGVLLTDTGTDGLMPVVLR